MGSPLLVMSCSQKKRAGPARAADLYDGPAYKTLRKSYTRVPVVVLSAEHGLISASAVLEYYDRMMDEARATEFCTKKAAGAARQLLRRTPGWPHDEVFCYGGALYRRVVRYYAEEGVFGTAHIFYSDGKIGEQLHQLKEFLMENRRPTATFLGRG